MRKASQGCIVLSAILVTKYSPAAMLRGCGGATNGLLALLWRLGGHRDEASKSWEPRWLTGCNTLARPRTREHPNPKINIIIYKVNLTTCTRRHTS